VAGHYHAHPKWLFRVVEAFLQELLEIVGVYPRIGLQDQALRLQRVPSFRKSGGDDLEAGPHDLSAMGIQLIGVIRCDFGPPLAQPALSCHKPFQGER